MEEADLRGGGGTLHRRSIYAPGETIARLAVFHGYGDHSGRYVSFMRWMGARGVTCHALDFRGHGLSEGRPGYVRRWPQYLDDLRDFLALPDLGAGGGDRRVPCFALGHSLGGPSCLPSPARGPARRRGLRADLAVPARARRGCRS